MTTITKAEKLNKTDRERVRERAKKELNIASILISKEVLYFTKITYSMQLVLLLRRLRLVVCFLIPYFVLILILCC